MPAMETCLRLVKGIARLFIDGRPHPGVFCSTPPQYMRNFIDPARELIAHKGAVQTTPEELHAVLRRLLDSPGERTELARNGQEAVRRNQGAIKRTLDLVEPFLGL
jgi:hypothetical protein